ncbi:hypothetical protein CV102_23135 [Natronococcus pandeyae]|uniref:Uncharacterized protein n=1 Tax=Natronococcus pandeyae TaxID=2055836 RepID=A0A8J8TNI5_9EURY|nr:hypothetical protein CV102_23135 [Natronococcus pandeyae]
MTGVVPIANGSVAVADDDSRHRSNAGRPDDRRRTVRRQYTELGVLEQRGSAYEMTAADTDRWNVRIEHT